MARPDAPNDPVFRLDARHRLGHQAIESHAGTAASSTDDFDFDEILQSMQQDLETPQRETTQRTPPILPPDPIPHLSAPAPLIRRSIQELESGSLDELLIHQLLGLERDSAEFRREYVRLRVESLMKARNAPHPTPAADSSGGPVAVAAAPDLFETRSPWRINRFRDLWAFFGPWLTAIFGIQLYAGHKLVDLLAKRDLFPDILPPHLATLILVGCASTGSAALLLRLRGRDFHDFTPSLLGIGALSALFAIAFHVLVDVV